MFFRLILPFFLLGGAATAAQSAQLQKIDHRVVSAGTEEVVLSFDAVVEPRVFSMGGSQPRIVFDFEGVGLQRVGKRLAPEAHLVKDIRMGIHREGGVKTRLVLDLGPPKEIKHSYSVDKRHNQLVIRLTSPAVAAKPREGARETRDAPAPQQVRRQVGTKEPVQAASGGAIAEKKREQADTAAKKKQEAAAGGKQETAATPPPVPPAAAEKKEGRGREAAAATAKAPPAEEKKEPAPGAPAASPPEPPAAPESTAAAEPTPPVAPAPVPTPAPTGTAPGTAGLPAPATAQAPDAVTTAAPEPASPETPPVTPYLFAIQFDPDSPKGELIQFKLNGFYPPVLRSIETGTPQIICEFANLEVAPALEGPIKISGRHVKAIRLDKSAGSGKVRVFIELEPNYSYDLQQVFFREDNFFVLIVNAGKQ